MLSLWWNSTRRVQGTLQRWGWAGGWNNTAWSADLSGQRCLVPYSLCWCQFTPSSPRCVSCLTISRMAVFQCGCCLGTGYGSACGRQSALLAFASLFINPLICCCSSLPSVLDLLNCLYLEPLLCHLSFSCSPWGLCVCMATGWGQSTLWSKCLQTECLKTAFRDGHLKYLIKCILLSRPEIQPWFMFMIFPQSLSVLFMMRENTVLRRYIVIYALKGKHEEKRRELVYI